MRALEKTLRVTILTATAILLAAINAFPQLRIDTAQLSKDIKTYKQHATSLNEHQKNLKQAVEQEVTGKLLHYASASRNDTASTNGPKLQISLLTCGPGQEIYEYYGHSAIRILRTDSIGFDVVFNYGVFDFSSSNFAMRFALGHTDYICAMQQTSDFVEHYRQKGIYIDEQVLNLNQQEAAHLLEMLVENSKAENCVYRYNFFYDNCATRVRDKIEACIQGQLKYPERPTSRTLREATHFYCHYYEWSTFGQDLLLGSQADMPASGRELQFAPLIMRQDFAMTLILDRTGMMHTLVKDTHRLLDMPPLRPNHAFPLSPLVVAVIILIADIAIGITELKKNKIFWGIDSAAIAIQGVAGIIVAFLFFFSTHPTVGSNWLVWVLNPLPLIGLYWQIKGARNKRYYSYHCIAAPILAAFIIAIPFISQYISTPMVLLSAFLLWRSTVSLIVWLKLRKRV